MKWFPSILSITAAVFLNIFSRYKNGFPILSSLGSFTLTLSLFLVLITVIDRINSLNLKKYGFAIAEQWKKVKRLFVNDKEAPPITEKVEKNAAEGQLREQQSALLQDGLLEIKRENVSQAREADTSLEKRVLSALYIVSFLGIAIWRARAIFRAVTLSNTAQYSGSIADALLLLVLPCIAVLYLKMKKESTDSSSSPIEAISRDLLSFFAYTSLFYAALIAASSVLKIRFLIILPWLSCAASAYLIVSLAVNIALSILQGDIFSFNYTLFPNNQAQAEKWKVSLKSLYTIKYTLSILPAFVFALFFVLLLSTTIFVVQPHQQAAVFRFGKLEPSSIKNEGLHLKFPWPVEKTEIYDVHRVSSMQIGYESSRGANFLWGQEHDGGEYMLLLGNGNEITAVNLKIIYIISDLYAYIKTCTNPQALLSAAAYNALMSRTVNTTLDTFLSVDRNSLSASMLDELSWFCQSENLGFSVVQVVIESIHPPVELANVYQNVVSASVEKTTLITRAQGYAEAKIIEAQKQSKTAIEGARAMQYSKLSDAQKEIAVFYAAAEAYRLSSVSFELTKSLEVYEKIIGGNKVYVFSPGMANNISKFIIGKTDTVIGGINE